MYHPIQDPEHRTSSRFPVPLPPPPPHCSLRAPHFWFSRTLFLFFVMVPSSSPLNIALIVQMPRTLPAPVPQVQKTLNSGSSQSTKFVALAFPVLPWLFPIVF